MVDIGQERLDGLQQASQADALQAAGVADLGVQIQAQAVGAQGQHRQDAAEPEHQRPQRCPVLVRQNGRPGLQLPDVEFHNDPSDGSNDKKSVTQNPRNSK